METDDTLCSQDPATGPSNDSGESSPHLRTLFFQQQFNIILLPGPRSSERSVSLRFSDQTFVRISHFSHSCYMPRPLHVLDLVMRESYEAPHYAVFFIFLPLTPFQVQIFSSALCSHLRDLMLLRRSIFQVKVFWIVTPCPRLQFPEFNLLVITFCVCASHLLLWRNVFRNVVITC
jgi:hypothetical protein